MSDCFVETNGITMHYVDHGGEGRVLLLIPGLTANAHSFDGLVHAGFTGLGHALALDMRDTRSRITGATSSVSSMHSSSIASSRSATRSAG